MSECFISALIDAGISVCKSLMLTRGFSFVVHGWLHTECPPICCNAFVLGNNRIRSTQQS